MACNYKVHLRAASPFWRWYEQTFKDMFCDLGRLCRLWDSEREEERERELKRELERDGSREILNAATWVIYSSRRRFTWSFASFHE
ncbi:unnamed protein product [Echinostoma caproni]|uniref:Uncharacterized protein n=1 Tax=Echinostoma caproni TaxID=27848 RepID=A0A183BEP1_9TREM|nr:unnamed protein product [Echinostoma caproni]